MKMENKEKEYISIIILTLLHGLYTYCALGKMPYIALGIFEWVSMSAFLMWTIYSMGLYLIVQKWIVQEDNMKKQYILAVLFGIISAFVKGGIDFIVEKLVNHLKSVIKLACLDEATTFIFFILLSCVLLRVIARKKICYKKKIKLPLSILIVILISYLAFVGNYLWQNQAAIEVFNANEEEIFNLDYHFGMKILDGNVWFYIIFYIIFWWFMRRLTEAEE